MIYLMDFDHQDLYQSAGLLPSSTKNIKRIRVNLHGTPSYRDYEITMDKLGNPIEFNKGKIKNFCGIKAEDFYSLPVLSPTGQELAMEIDGTMKIFRFNKDEQCELVDDLGFSTSKISFYYPRSRKKRYDCLYFI